MLALSTYQRRLANVARTLLERHKVSAACEALQCSCDDRPRRPLILSEPPETCVTAKQQGGMRPSGFWRREHARGGLMPRYHILVWELPPPFSRAPRRYEIFWGWGGDHALQSALCYHGIRCFTSPCKSSARCVFPNREMSMSIMRPTRIGVRSTPGRAECGAFWKGSPGQWNL
ncbi:hypothetical protein L209DRAFT_375306 [Thermothelomyces heterothallicus CBS 203.75]